MMALPSLQVTCPARRPSLANCKSSSLSSARAHHHGRVGGPVFGSLRAGAFFAGRPEGQEGQEKDGQQKKAAFLSTRWHNMMDFTVRRCGRRERKRKAWI